MKDHHGKEVGCSDRLWVCGTLTQRSLQKHDNNVNKTKHLESLNLRQGQIMLCFNPSSGEWTNFKVFGSLSMP